MKRSFTLFTFLALANCCFACGQLHLIKVTPENQSKHGITAEFKLEITSEFAPANMLGFYITCPTVGSNDASFFYINLELYDNGKTLLKTKIPVEQSEGLIKGYFEIAESRVGNAGVEITYATSVDNFHHYQYILWMDSYLDEYKKTHNQKLDPNGTKLRLKQPRNLKGIDA